MATKKDLVEAYSFSRRRLVTAFVSGAPGGREVEPARPGRMIIGGVALAILLIAGAAVAGALTGSATPDLKKPGLITDERGALYIILQSDESPDAPVIRPVINVTSAQLILGDVGKVTKVDDEVLAPKNKGPAIGILNAPAIVPPASELINDRWLSCTAAGAGVRTEIARNQPVQPTPTEGFVVETRGKKKRYLIAEASAPNLPTRAYAYALPADYEGLLDAVGASPPIPISVPDKWVALFPAGGALDDSGLGIADWGAPADLPGYPRARVGDIDVSRSRPYVVTKDGLVALTPFAEAVVRKTRLGSGLPRDVESTSPLKIAPTTPYDDAHWPEALLTGAADQTDQVCGQLTTTEGQQPAVRLATAPAGSAMLDGVEADDSDGMVESGFGAVVRSGDWSKSSGGTVYLIDDSGRSYSIAGPTEVDNLGYGKVAPVVVPDVWIRMFIPGPDLSRLAALCPPRPSTPGEKPAKGNTC